ncbi:homocysteine S-methyltransferase family protein [Mangrovicoccus sp. HB161399]|uniref:homocysteine S-methyltransferase family protein n=1 Tax=Mangrovicoccus sp. HB161399 TaxID=2720392 RepID=UPI001555CC8E|nr:homocysteine S-methyltransferase family protein [Mangrovicoccus sp. HB161399]
MPRPAPLLPHQTDGIFLTDGGNETWLMYKRGFELPHFSAFHLLSDPVATEAVREYYRHFAELAVRFGTPFIFCSMTYRASRDWGRLLGYSGEGLAEMNRRCLDLYREVASEAGLPPEKTVISGCIGPKGDAYGTGHRLGAAEAEDYHAEQIATFREAGAHVVTALTLNSVEEATGIARAARAARLPSAISFTLEKDRKLATGATLEEAIAAVDAATESSPAYYMVNCSHPLDFGPALPRAPWAGRIRGIRANASTLDHGTLCQLGHLEESDPDELAAQYRELRAAHPEMNVFGGFCGTDYVHIAKIAEALLAPA